MNPIKTEEVVFQADGNPVSGYLARPADPQGGILVLHAWWGLNPFFKQYCERLAGEGFVVFAPDLNQGKIAQTIAEAEKLMEERRFAPTNAAVLGGADFLRQQPGVAGRKLGVIGFSMGGSWSLHLSSVLPDAVAAVSLYYAVEGVDFSSVTAEFQGHFAETDEWTPAEAVIQMEGDMRLAGLKPEFYHYPGTGHWFVEADRPDAYQPEAAALAWERTVKFFTDRIA
jgi:carboxymethylenebutenolidase